MTFEVFESSLKNDVPPVGLSPLLEALWYDGRGDWEQAHNLAQDVHSADGSWIHAYLHRKEGDLSNAAYWYRRAERPVAKGSLDEEWRRISMELLSRRDNKGIGGIG
jgi:hypothetical protein